MCSAVHEITLSCHADCSQDIVSRAHHIANPGLIELLNYTCCVMYKLILEDEEADEFKIRFSFKARHFLRLEPA